LLGKISTPNECPALRRTHNEYVAASGFEIYKDNIKVFTFSNYHIGIKDELQKNNLPYNSLLKTLKENRPIKAGTRKGYYMKKL